MSPPRPGASHLALLTLIAISLIPTATSADVIFRLKTNLPKMDGEGRPLRRHIDIALFTDFVQGEPSRLAVNFQKYAAQGLFDRSIIHYAHPSFVIQGGRIRHMGGEFSEVSRLDKVTGESNVPHARGTIALGRPKQGRRRPFSSEITDQFDLDDLDRPATPNCLRSRNKMQGEWFINLVNNQGVFGPLGCGADSFRVIGSVIGDGMQVVDRIAGLAIESGQYAVAMDTDPQIAVWLHNLPLLSPLDFVSAGSGCGDIEPHPERPSRFGIPKFMRLLDPDCSLAQINADLQARRDALGDEVPGRLVKIKKVKLIPATRGLDRFEFDEPIESRIEGVDDDGAACSIPEAGVVTVGVLNNDFTDWLFSLGESTWRAADTRLTQGYGGPILASSSRGSKLGLSEETVTLLERLLVARLERTVQVAFNPHEQNVIDSGTPRCREVEAGDCFQYSLSSLRGPDSTGQLQLTIDEQRLTVTTDEQRNLFKVSGEIRFTFDFSIRHKYFVAKGAGEFAQLCNQPAVSHPGSYSFDLSGPIRRHKN